jgi:DNA-binding SARP family transcriptional activator
VKAGTSAAAAAADVVEIRLLGTLRVRRMDGTVVDARDWRTAKTADLLRLLALRAGEPVPVDRLLDALWPDVDQARGRASLRTAASQVRRALGCDCVARRFGGLALTGAWVDAVAFRGLAREARRLSASRQPEQVVAVVREADALYLGDLSAHDQDAEWVREERDQLRALHVTVLADGADAALELGWMHDALDLAGRTLRLEPSAERAYRVEMLAHAGLGQTDQALRAFERCRAVLAEELGADPSPLTSAAHLQVLTAEPKLLSSVPLVGREQELSELRGVLDAALADGRPAAVVVWGGPGAGRSRLVEQACTGLAARVAVVDCGPSAGTPPAQALHQLAGAQSELLVLSHLDGPTATALAAGPCALRPAAVVVTMTSTDPPGDAIAGWLSRLGVVRVHDLPLRPLGREKIEELAAQLLAGQPTPQLVATLLAASAGMPARAVDVVRGWTSAGRIAAGSRGLVLMPETFGGDERLDVTAELLSLRDRLSEAEAEVMHLSALLEEPVRPAHLAGVLDGCGIEEIEAALRRLEDFAVLARDGSGYVFRNPLLRDAVLAWLRPSSRRRLHAALAERAPLSAAQRLGHWLEAGEHQLGCAAALEAADEAVASACYEDAREHLLQVCSLGDLPEMAVTDRLVLFERLGDVCSVLGLREEAGAAFAVALAMARSGGLPDIERITGKRRLLDRQAAHEAATVAEPAGLGAIQELAARLHLPADPEPAPELERRVRAAVEQADRGHDISVDRVVARLFLADLVLTPRRSLHSSWRWAQDALALTLDPQLRIQGVVVAFQPGVLLGCTERTLESLEEAWQEAQRAEPDELRERLALLLLLARHELGRSGSGVADWEEIGPGLAGSGAGPSRWHDGAVAELRWAVVRMLAERGDVAAALRAERSLAQARRDSRGGALRALAVARLRVALRSPSAAAAELQDAVATARASGRTLLLPELAARLAALTATADVHEAWALLDLAEEALGEAALGRERCAVALGSAAVRAAMGHAKAAADRAVAVAGTAEALGLVFQRAEALLDAARYQRQAGQWADAVATAHAAGGAYLSAGAPGTARRVRARAAQLARQLSLSPVPGPRHSGGLRMADDELEVGAIDTGEEVGPRIRVRPAAS